LNRFLNEPSEIAGIKMNARCHVVLPYAWVECLNELNAYPQEWLESLLGFAVESDEDGEAIVFRENGKIHRVDGPAVEWQQGDLQWYSHGELHRDGGPAVIGDDGEQQWFKQGKLHRVDGPAQIYPDGASFWYVNDKACPVYGPQLNNVSMFLT
jgi:hypothetical protein